MIRARRSAARHAARARAAALSTLADRATSDLARERACAPEDVDPQEAMERAEARLELNEEIWADGRSDR